MKSCPIIRREKRLKLGNGCKFSKALNQWYFNLLQILKLLIFIQPFSKNRQVVWMPSVNKILAAHTVRHGQLMVWKKVFRKHVIHYSTRTICTKSTIINSKKPIMKLVLVIIDKVCQGSTTRITLNVMVRIHCTMQWESSRKKQIGATYTSIKIPYN